MILDWNHIYIIAWRDTFGRVTIEKPETVFRKSRPIWVSGPGVIFSGPPVLKRKEINYARYEEFQIHLGNPAPTKAVMCLAWYIEEGFKRTDDLNEQDIPAEPVITPPIVVEPDSPTRFQLMGVRHGN